MSSEPNGLDVKIARCEEKIGYVEKKLDKFITNDFWHFREEMRGELAKANNRTWWVLGTIVIGFLTMIYLSLL